MDGWRIATVVATCFLAAGCQSGAELRTQLLERELRMQEDCIFDLENQLDATERRLEATRRENEALRREKGSPSGRTGGSRDEGYYEPPVTSPPTVSAPAVESNIPFVPLPSTGPLEEAPPYQGPPTLDPIDPSAPPSSSLPPMSGSGVELLPDGSASMMDGEQTPLKRLQFLMQSQAVEPEETDFHITGITLNRMLTGGYDLDDRFGDEGVMVVIEPRNAAGRIVNVPAQVSIVLLDPSQPPPTARVARWDFTADEAANHFRRSRLARGMHFQLPWPDRPPAQQDLELHVRAITTDGHELRAQRAVTIDIPGRPSHRWTSAGAARHNGARGDALGHEYAGPLAPARQEPTLALAPADDSQYGETYVAESGLQPTLLLPPEESEPVQQVSTTARHDAAPLPPMSLEQAADGLLLADEIAPQSLAATPRQAEEPRRLELGTGVDAPRPLAPQPQARRRSAEWSPYR
ncbi:MAG: hypothetical protein KF708_10085 [Pirellulales bacterium]|nr:hypothetical protein [Pirellulales bacterium]